MDLSLAIKDAATAMETLLVYQYLKSPTHPQKSPTYPQKSPAHPQKRPAHPQKSPTHSQKSLTHEHLLAIKNKAAVLIRATSLHFKVIKAMIVIQTALHICKRALQIKNKAAV